MKKGLPRGPMTGVGVRARYMTKRANKRGSANHFLKECTRFTRYRVKPSIVRKLRGWNCLAVRMDIITGRER